MRMERIWARSPLPLTPPNELVGDMLHSLTWCRASGTFSYISHPIKYSALKAGTWWGPENASSLMHAQHPAAWPARPVGSDRSFSGQAVKPQSRRLFLMHTENVLKRNVYILHLYQGAGCGNHAWGCCPAGRCPRLQQLQGHEFWRSF